MSKECLKGSLCLCIGRRDVQRQRERVDGARCELIEALSVLEHGGKVDVARQQHDSMQPVVPNEIEELLALVLKVAPACGCGQIGKKVSKQKAEREREEIEMYGLAISFGI